MAPRGRFVKFAISREAIELMLHRVFSRSLIVVTALATNLFPLFHFPLFLSPLLLPPPFPPSDSNTLLGSPPIMPPEQSDFLAKSAASACMHACVVRLCEHYSWKLLSFCTGDQYMRGFFFFCCA